MNRDTAGRMRGTGGVRVWARLLAFSLTPLLALCACTEAERIPASLQAADIRPEIAAGVPEMEAPLSVDGREIPAWRYLFWLARARERAEARFRDDRTPDWESVTEDGRTLAEQVREEALRDTVLYASVENLAEAHGLSLNEADAEAVAERWREWCDAAGGESACLKALARYGLDRERTEQLFQAGQLYGKLAALCREEDSGFSPDSGTLNALAREKGMVRVDRILEAAGENRNAARRKAEEAFQRLNGAADQAALFRVLAEEGDDPAGPRTLTDAGNGGGPLLDDTLKQVAGALDIGELSGIIETEEGFSILLRLPPEREALLDTWLDRTIQEAAEAADIHLTERYEALGVAALAGGFPP